MIDVLIRHLNESFGYGIWVFDKDDTTGKTKILECEGPFSWKEAIPGHLLPKPLISTSTREGEAIFEKFLERVKEAGFGRDKVSIESGELKATKEHLADMKKLVFSPPHHFTPQIITVGETSPGRYQPKERIYGEAPVYSARLRKAAKRCPQAETVLKEIFPEVFTSGWQSLDD